MDQDKIRRLAAKLSLNHNIRFVKIKRIRNQFEEGKELPAREDGGLEITEVKSERSNSLSPGMRRRHKKISAMQTGIFDSPYYFDQ